MRLLCTYTNATKCWVLAYSHEDRGVDSHYLPFLVSGIGARCTQRGI